MGQLVEHVYSVHFENGGRVIYNKGIKGNIIKSREMEKNRKFPLGFNYAANMVLKAQKTDES